MLCVTLNGGSRRISRWSKEQLSPTFLLSEQFFSEQFLVPLGKASQGSHRSWKTWKVMEFVISISRPEKSWNLSEGHGKSWKSNMLGRQMF